MQHIRRAESAAHSFHKTASEDAAQLRNPLQKKEKKHANTIKPVSSYHNIFGWKPKAFHFVHFFLAVKRSIKNRVKNILQIHFSLWHSIKDKQHFPSKASIVNRWAEWIYCPTPISYQPNCPTNYSSLYSAVLFYSDGRGLQMIFTCVGCFFVVGGVRALLWIWLWELSWSAILISAGLWSNATSSKSTLISAELVYRPGDFTTTTAQGRFWEVGGMNKDLSTL